MLVQGMRAIVNAVLVAPCEVAGVTVRLWKIQVGGALCGISPPRHTQGLSRFPGEKLPLHRGNFGGGRGLHLLYLGIHVGL